MTDNEGAAAPANEQAQVAPAADEQATQTQPEAGVQEDAAPENAETQEQPEPKRRSTSDRYRRKISAQAGVIERLASELESLKQSATRQAPDMPKASDYPHGEFDPQYVADLAAIKAEQKISTKLEEQTKRAEQARAAEQGQRAFAEFDRHAEKFRTAIPDFDRAIESFVEDGGKFEPHVASRIHKLGEKGPQVAYHLAKNPDLADALNEMDPVEAAVELARIETRLSLPQPRKQTQASPPIAPLTGGASKAFNPYDTDDMAAYVKWRKAQS